jgi:hypothetical protein
MYYNNIDAHGVKSPGLQSALLRLAPAPTFFARNDAAISIIDLPAAPGSPPGSFRRGPHPLSIGIFMEG